MANLTNIQVSNLLNSLRTVVGEDGLEFTQSDKETLRHIKYNAITKKIEADKPIETTLNSYYLGEQHKMSSGSENIFFSNLTTNTNFYPAWGGVKDHSDSANHDASGLLHPTGRCYTDDLLLANLGGSPVDDTAIPYDGDNYFPNNISGFGITTRIAENVSSGIRLLYELSVNGTPVYNQILEHNGLVPNQDLSWWFDHPLDILAGSTNHASITKIDSEDTPLGLLLVCEGDNTVTWGGTRYQTTVRNRGFNDKPIAFTDQIAGDVTGFYDIYLDPSFSGSNSDGSITKPYKTMAEVVSASVAGSKIFCKGEVLFATEQILPHSLHFYGIDGTVFKYDTYAPTNGNILKFTGTDTTQEFSFHNIEFRNAGEYAIKITGGAKSCEIVDCSFINNGWNGQGLNTVLAESSNLLGYDSEQGDLQAFYAGNNASNGGCMRLETITSVQIVGNTCLNNLRGIRLADCGIGGNGFITRNVSAQNIESGIYLSTGALLGCQNLTVSMNFSSFNANNGLLCVGGINNKFSQNEVNGNWNAGFCAWGSANTTMRDSGLYDNNRSAFNGIGNNADALASVQINEYYNLIGTIISMSPDAKFICEILDTQIHYTGIGSNTDKVGILITSGVGNLPDNDKNIIKIDDVGFIGQDYAIDFSNVDVSNLRISLGDNSYQSIVKTAVKAPLNGNYNELPFSNHLMSVPKVDVVVDTLKNVISLHEDVGGSVINSYKVNELQSVINGTKCDIILKNTDKIQLRGLTLGNVYVNSVVAGANLNTMNDTLNGAFSMNLTNYKTFLESEVGVVGQENSSTAHFYYIESPDGNFEFPLFKTQAEAETVDTSEGGSGSASTITYVDDTSGTTWYKPDTNFTDNGTVAPENGIWSNSESVVWNIQNTAPDSNFAPTFTDITYTIGEGSAVNIQYKAQGNTNTYQISNIPAGYADTGFAIVGTAESITNGVDIQYTLSVSVVNEFGSATGSIILNITDDPSNNLTSNDTNWTKAVKFNAGGRYLSQVSTASSTCPVKMFGGSSTVTANSDLTKTSDHQYSAPWSVAVVFKHGSMNGVQYIWNVGEGNNVNNDNIYLKLVNSFSSGQLYFGWGRQGVGYNEFLIGNYGGSANMDKWFGVYVGFKGQRFSSSLATQQNLANAFEFKVMKGDDSVPFDAVYTEGGSANWNSYGVRMDRTVDGLLTIAGRGSNNNAFAEVASFVVTTLKRDELMPTDAEVKLMITDPKKWMNTHKIGSSYRKSNAVSNTSNFQLYNTDANRATQIWLMGDGVQDSFSNGVRNLVKPLDQNDSKLQFNNMASNDIVNVNISGLS